MTLQESGAWAIAAAEAGDMATLERAMRARGEAIVELQRVAPSYEVAGRVADALKSGEAIGWALLQSKRRLGVESGRLARLVETLAVGCGVVRRDD